MFPEGYEYKFGTHYSLGELAFSAMNDIGELSFLFVFSILTLLWMRALMKNKYNHFVKPVAITALVVIVILQVCCLFLPAVLPDGSRRFVDLGNRIWHLVMYVAYSVTTVVCLTISRRRIHFAPNRSVFKENFLEQFYSTAFCNCFSLFHVVSAILDLAGVRIGLFVFRLSSIIMFACEIIPSFLVLYFFRERKHFEEKTSLLNPSSNPSHANIQETLPRRKNIQVFKRKPPKAYSVARSVRAGEQFNIIVRSYNREELDSIRLNPGANFTLLDSEIKEGGFKPKHLSKKWYKHFSIQAKNAGEHSIVVQVEGIRESVQGSPISITVKAPKPSASIEESNDIYAGDVFHVVITGYYREEVDACMPVRCDGVQPLQSETKRGVYCSTHHMTKWHKRIPFRAATVGRRYVAIKIDDDSSPVSLFVTVNHPKPSVSIEGNSTIRAGDSFCILVTGYVRGQVEAATVRLSRGMTNLGSELSQSRELSVFGCQSHYKRFHIRAITSGRLPVEVMNGRDQIKGSPINVQILPGPINLDHSSTLPCNGEVPAAGFICETEKVVDYAFSPCDEFENPIPCDKSIESQLSVQCDSDLLILEKRTNGNHIELQLRPLGPGQVYVMPMFGSIPLLSNPITIITVPPSMKKNAELSDVRCSLLSSCVDEVGEAEKDEEGRNALVFVSPLFVTVKRRRLFFLSTFMRWPINQALLLTVVEKPEEKHLPIDTQSAFLDIKEEGVGRVRLSLPKLDALRIAAVTMHTLNGKYVGGPLEYRKEVLKTRLVQKKSSFSTMNFSMRREDIIHQAWSQFSSKSEPGSLLVETHVRLEGERGLDAGGLSKEFMTTLQNDLFSLESGLWAPVPMAIDYQPSVAPAPVVPGVDGNGGANSTDEESEKLFAPIIPRLDPSMELSRRTGVSLTDLYKLCGIVAARTLSDCVCGSGKSLLPFRIASSVFKYVLSIPVRTEDCNCDDPGFFKSTVSQILENDVEGLDMFFAQSLFTPNKQLVRTVCIDPQSKKYYALAMKRGKPMETVTEESCRPVTEENKQQYVEELVRFRLRGAMLPHLAAFREGFLLAIPDDDVALLKPDELVFLTCTTATIDPEDLRANTEVINANPERMRWFWQAVAMFKESERRKLLLFTTGSLCAPLGGFAKLKPKFKVCCLRIGSHDNLPVAHACFNQIDLPPYRSFDELFTKLRMAITEGEGCFALA